MCQAFPIHQEQSKLHLSQPAMAKCLRQAVLPRCLITNSFLCSRGCNTLHEARQDEPAKLITPSRMSQPSAPQDGVLGACGPALPSIVITPPAETPQPEQADLAAQNVTASPVPVSAAILSTALQVAPAAIPESPCSTALPTSSPVLPTQSTTDPSTSLPGKWLCPLRPPPLPLNLESLILPLKWEKRAIRSQKECVHWFKSNGDDSLHSPPDSRSAYDSPLQIADLYIHQNNHESVQQIWMWTGHRWDAVKPDCTHPIMSEYHLKILDKGEPSWVMRKMMVSDHGRAKQKLEK
ncbi:hypothetical protein BKA82DRAFT_9424 [Pisolithus tinctorius]|uniref:Uncharacterized protein n=1 Tax=Pisolithus tinctorius Marx 270 TaxID=870435 RepID=A0A0C3P800_PISTI|nr:hypothetical protein BKA82DRAFT_9424 [Pisolithus tinctorius]KIO03791.1 hypothetical protein M404DRAFT_9424 [Pisolithus tinctorius Marx 270]